MDGVVKAEKLVEGAKAVYARPLTATSTGKQNVSRSWNHEN
ncbi:hypothetical protein ACVXHB_21065 [Escherichia coli]